MIFVTAKVVTVGTDFAGVPGPEDFLQAAQENEMKSRAIEIVFILVGINNGLKSIISDNVLS